MPSHKTAHVVIAFSSSQLQLQGLAKTLSLAFYTIASIKAKFHFTSCAQAWLKDIKPLSPLYLIHKTRVSLYTVCVCLYVYVCV